MTTYILPSYHPVSFSKYFIQCSYLCIKIITNKRTDKSDHLHFAIVSPNFFFEVLHPAFISINIITNKRTDKSDRSHFAIVSPSFIELWWLAGVLVTGKDTIPISAAAAAASSRMSPGKFVEQCGQSREFCKGYAMVITGRGSPVALCTCGTVGSASSAVGGSSAAVVDVVDVSSVPMVASTVTMGYASVGVIISVMTSSAGVSYPRWPLLLCRGLCLHGTLLFWGVPISTVTVSSGRMLVSFVYSTVMVSVSSSLYSSSESDGATTLGSSWLNSVLQFGCSFRNLSLSPFTLWVVFLLFNCLAISTF